MPPNLEAMLRSAIEYVKANRKAEARRLLEQIVSVDQMNEQAWLWLSACVDTVEEQTICLENVLDINPNNQKAIKGLQALQARHAPPADDPFAGSPFGSAPVDDPFAGSPFSSAQVASPPTSVEWGRGSESASGRGSGGSVPAFSDEDYDAWLANLPLGTSNSVFTSVPSTEAPFSPPTDQFADDLDNFDFSSMYPPIPGAEERTDEPSERLSAPSVSPFGYADESLFAESDDSPLAEVFSEEALFEAEPPDLSLYQPPESFDESPFEQGDDAPLSPEDLVSPEPAPLPPPPRPRSAPPSLFGGKGRGKLGRSVSYSDSSDPFARIPEEIQVAPAPRALPIGVLVLAGLNAVAAIVLIINLFS